MGLSFEDSVKAAQEIETSVVNTPLNFVAAASIEEDDSNTIATLSLRSGNINEWIIDDINYQYYEEYNDENLSVINDEKYITLHPKQFNITQETNSQYIPFEMPRYYDGFDLTNTKLQIYFVNKNGHGSVAYPINVSYNEDMIRFAWLVDSRATQVEGVVQFEIQAVGENSKGDSYLWKSRSTEDLNVIKSLTSIGYIEPDQEWQDDFMARITGQVTIAQEAANNAEESVSEVKSYAEQAMHSANDAATAAAEAASAFDSQIDEKVSEKIDEVIGDNYYTKTEIDNADYANKTYVNDAVASVDVTEQLVDYATKTELAEAIASVDVSDEINALETRISDNYALKSDVNDVIGDIGESTVKDYVDDAVADVDVSGQLVNYATTSYVDTKVNPLTSSINTNAQNISTLSEKVSDFETIVGNLDTSSRLTYNATYDEDFVYTLWEIENEGNADTEVRNPKAQFKIQGGSGGGTSSILKIEYITTSPIVATLKDRVVIKYNFSGTDSSGDAVSDGTATWRVGSRVVATNIVVAGENSFDITDYLSVGTQKVNLSIIDDAGSLVTKSWTVQKIDVRLESGFNDKLTYPMNSVVFDYTPYGAIEKVVHFSLDGTEIHSVTTSSSGIPMSYEIPVQTHGSHTLEAYITATINGNEIESNHIVKDIIWYDSTSAVPVIGCNKQNISVLQYDAINIEYTVYDPSTDTPTVTLSVDGDVVSTLTLDGNTQVWQYKANEDGKHTLTITCGETVKTIIVDVEKLNIDVSPVTTGLVFDFNPAGKTNNDSDRLWSDGDITMSVSDNFDWVNGGYQIDENGDQYFCVKSGTNAVIDYNLFADDPKRSGKEFKVIFKTTNIKKRDTSFISCMDNNIGLDMKIESAGIYSSNNNLYSPYCEEDVIEFEFNINKDTDIPMVMTYEDGVGNRPMIYTSDSSFVQSTPKPITIGSDDCDVYIYRMKAYSNSLNDRDILANFITDARNADEMISRYTRNQIYDENEMLTPEVFAEKCPDLRVIMIDAPWFTNDKSNKVEDTNITMIYKNGDPVLDNWTCTGAKHSGQGTSSNEYGYAGRNLDLIMDGDSSLFTLGDGVTTSKTITLTRDSVPTDYLNCKVNIASSENQNNAQMARRYNEYNPFKRTAKIKDNKVKDTMEFYNCVIFVRERNEDITTHREFLDTNYHYYSLANVGDSKKTDDTRVNDKNDPKECIVEIVDYNVVLAEFPTGVDGEYCPVDQWVTGNEAYDYLYADYEYKDGEFKSFGSESYEFRYEMKNITDEQRQTNIDAWRELYKFIVTSTNDEFYTNLKKYFVVDSALYYYLFTERYLMVDNRAKNSFWHYGKAYYSQVEAAEFAETYGNEIDSKYIDDEQAAFNEGYRWDLTFGYDFDTSLGIDNTGKLVLTYGKEDSDFYVDGDPSSSYIYRAAESKFFCRVRDLFESELQAMFVDRENVNAWSADGLLNQWDNAQKQFPEEIWRLDIQRKYLRTYQGVSIDNSIAGTANQRFLVEMMNGRKKYQRRMFERNQELYMATKYFGNRATQDQIMMRFNNPVDAVVEQDYTLYLTPYSDMYIGIKFGNVSPVNFRAKAGVEYTIPYSIGADTADITLIYGASFIQSIGDLSRCYVGDNDFSKASRLQSLVIGSDAEGYDNAYMTKINLGNNRLLEYLDIRNITGLNSVVDLSQCNNLLELHAEGSGATGIIFSNGGKIEKAYMPSIISLTAKNLNNLIVFDIESYDNIQTLIVENTPFINTYNIVNSSDKLSILRLIGIDWNASYNIEYSSILNRLLGIRGIGNDGYEIPVSVLTGKFHSATVKQKELETYVETWKDLEITFNTLIEQYEVKFVNYDGSVLDVQYVDKGGNAIDPITREDNPIDIPMKPSSVSTDYVFDGWDSSLTSVFSDRVVTALYNESTRSYTIKYVSKGTVLQTATGLYGDNIVYDGAIPTYTLEENAYKYYLFNRWDKSGFIDGDKTVNAVFDTFEYTENVFNGKQLNELSPVEIYALTKLGLDSVSMNIQDGDDYSFELGYDVDYDDIESEVIISDKIRFDGTNYLDTGIKLFDEDKDFVIAIDYKFSSDNSLNNVLMQCFQSNGSNGFKLWYNNGIKFTWGTTTDTPTIANSREMLVIRHRKGDNNLTIYNSNLDTDASNSIELTRTRDTITDSTLVFGCAKADDGAYENYAVGDINWCKIWYKDLGDSACEKLVSWTHEKIEAEVCGFKRYYLTENPSKRCNFTMLATHLLDRSRVYNSTNTNIGGWASSGLNAFLNSRFYNAVPDQIKMLLKQVTVNSSSGNMSTEIVASDCYIAIPSVIEVSNATSFNKEPYLYEGTTISYMINNDARKRRYIDGDYAGYWLRSPNSDYANYVYTVNASGETYGFTIANSSKLGILIEFSF